MRMMTSVRAAIAATAIACAFPAALTPAHAFEVICCEQSTRGGNLDIDFQFVFDRHEVDTMNDISGALQFLGPLRGITSDILNRYIDAIRSRVGRNGAHVKAT